MSDNELTIDKLKRARDILAAAPVNVDEIDGFLNHKGNLVRLQLLARAAQIVREDRKTSTSYLQRRLEIGYSQAAALIDIMEEMGVVTPANHLGKREVIDA